MNTQLALLLLRQLHDLLFPRCNNAHSQGPCTKVLDTAESAFFGGQTAATAQTSKWCRLVAVLSTKTVLVGRADRAESVV